MRSTSPVQVRRYCCRTDNFLRLGFEGYRQVQQASQDVARRLSSAIAEMGPFELLSDGTDLPVFAWRLGPNCSGMWDLHDLSNELREQGWQVPAYPLPDNLSSTDRATHRRAQRGVHGPRRLPAGRHTHCRQTPVRTCPAQCHARPGPIPPTTTEALGVTVGHAPCAK